MFKLVTWNIEQARSRAGGTDIGNIIDSLERFSGFDVLCVQQVASGFEARDGSDGGDQVAQLAALLPGYSAASACGVDTLRADGSRRRMGCMLFSRHPVLQILRHSLPWPPDPQVTSMPRVALEATLDTPLGLLRVTNTHLEYFSQRQRSAQIARLRDLHSEADAHARSVRPGESSAAACARVPRASTAILTGDFNMLPHSVEYAQLLAPFAHAGPALLDAWQLVHPELPHAPTVGLHDDSPGAAAPFTFDYLFVSDQLRRRVNEVRVDTALSGSGHQALLLELH
jgi:endonuclease/exonuclease/phosphatase family metal-dependent hydrolase